MKRQERIEQLIYELPDRDQVKSIPHIDRLFDELLALNPSLHEMERALDGTRLTAHMLGSILSRLAAIERWISYLNKVNKCSS